MRVRSAPGPQTIAAMCRLPLASGSVELEVVDLAAQAIVAVDELTVQELEPGMEDPTGGHHAPALVMIINGIVATDTTRRMPR